MKRHRKTSPTATPCAADAPDRACHVGPQLAAPASENLFNLDELVLVRTKADLLAVLDHGLPIRVGVRHVEVIVRVLLVQVHARGLQLGATLCELGVGHRGLR